LLEESSLVLDFAAVGTGRASAPDGRSAAIPSGLASLRGAWAGIPLIHCGRLQGLVVIAHPPLKRALDWEDYDLFRAAGRQAASYLAEARTLEALAEARRFDEFNRRFAFILHDVKNLVSQLSLVARNAQRHADNPEFRADMVATLQSSVKKMNDLLARLAPGAKPRSGISPRAVTLHPVLAAVAEAKRRAHPVELSGDARLAVLADPAALEQAVATWSRTPSTPAPRTRRSRSASPRRVTGCASRSRIAAAACRPTSSPGACSSRSPPPRMAASASARMRPGR
jgi:signal transduction histidine kinase